MPVESEEVQMLVLTRKVAEGLKIGDEVAVYILSVAGERVRIGIEAPREIQVIRTELGDWDHAKRPRSIARNAIEATSELGKNGYGTPWTDKDCAVPEPTQHLPGTKDKIEVMAERVRNGQDVHSEADPILVPPSGAEIEQLVSAEIEEDMVPRRRRLLEHQLCRVDERKAGWPASYGYWLYVDQIQSIGCAIKVHLRDRHEWIDMDWLVDMLETKDVLDVICRAASGDDEVSEEIPCER